MHGYIHMKRGWALSPCANVWPALMGEDPVGTPLLIEEARGVALRQGNWKYIAGRGKNPGELYDLSKDIGEQENLISSEGERALKMKALLDSLVNDDKGVRQALASK